MLGPLGEPCGLLHAALHKGLIEHIAICPCEGLLFRVRDVQQQMLLKVDASKMHAVHFGMEDYKLHEEEATIDGFVVSLMGAFTTMLVSFILPVAFYLYACRASLGPLAVGANVFIIVVGLVGMFVGVQSTLASQM